MPRPANKKELLELAEINFGGDPQSMIAVKRSRN
jgi:hypothetical protein